MRGLAIVWVLGACSYTPPRAVGDGGIDAPNDTPMDMPIDMAETGRVTSGLVGLWTFETAAPLVETSGFGPPVNLTPSGTVNFGPGTVETLDTPAPIAKLETSPNPRLNADCVNGGGVTLEAWVLPTSAVQGSTNDKRVVAGLTSSSASRNVSLFQVGDQWLARVRTNNDTNGAPDLVPVSDTVVATMTHLVVVADENQRILYVNGDMKATDLAPGALQNWDPSYRLILGNEFQQSRPWIGTFELVAMYGRALSSTEVGRNFLAGPTP